MFSWMKSSSGCEWTGCKAISFDCTLVLILTYSTEKCSVFLALFLLLLNMFWRNDCCCGLQFSMENYRGLIQDMSPQDREVSRPKQFSLLLWQIVILVCVTEMVTSEIIRILTKCRWSYFLISPVYYLFVSWVTITLIVSFDLFVSKTPSTEKFKTYIKYSEFSEFFAKIPARILVDKICALSRV